MPMVVRMVIMAEPARRSVPPTNLRPWTYLMTLRIRMKPKGRETEARVLPGAGNTVAIDPIARIASPTFQYVHHRLHRIDLKSLQEN